jgi:hypothetical protein
MTDPLCECADIHCTSTTHPSRSPCGAPGTLQLRRVDYSDYGIDDWLVFCEGCSEDALASGVFDIFGSTPTDFSDF